MKSKPQANVSWTPRHDQIIKIVSPEVAAKKLGLTVEVVLARRKQMGLSKFEPQAKPAHGLSNRQRRAKQSAGARKKPAKAIGS